MKTTTRLAPNPEVILDPERLLGFQGLAAESDTNPDWAMALADQHNKIGVDGGELPPNPPGISAV